MDEDNANFERNLKGFTLSVLYAACSELDADALSDRQTEKDTYKTTLETNKERVETASYDERAATFKRLRNTELDRLTKAINKTRYEQTTYNKDDQTNKGMNTEKDKETANEEERAAAFFKNVRNKEIDRLSAGTMNKQSNEAGNQYDKFEPNVLNKEGSQNLDETEALETEETASKENRLAFFQSVRDAERKKLLNAFERDTIWKEEKEKRRMRRRQEKIKTMFNEFHTPAVSVLSASYSSPEQAPDPRNDNYHQRSKSTTDLRTKQVDIEEVKLDLTLLGDNKDKEDNPDTPRSSNSVWYTFSELKDPPRPRLEPIFTPLEERHETTTVHLSGPTKPNSTESVNPLLLDLTSTSSLEHGNSCTHEPIKRLLAESTDKTEPTKSVQIEKPDQKHSESTIVNSLKSGRFRRFRKWFKRLCCCCSKNAEESEKVFS